MASNRTTSICFSLFSPRVPWSCGHGAAAWPSMCVMLSEQTGSVPSTKTRAHTCASTIAPCFSHCSTSEWNRIIISTAKQTGEGGKQPRKPRGCSQKRNLTHTHTHTSKIWPFSGFWKQQQQKKKTRTARTLMKEARTRQRNIKRWSWTNSCSGVSVSDSKTPRRRRFEEMKALTAVQLYRKLQDNMTKDSFKQIYSLAWPI